MISRQILMQNVSDMLVTTNIEDLGNLFPTISEWRHIKVYFILKLFCYYYFIDY